MNEHLCSQGHLWYSDEEPAPVRTCPEHEFPFHNGPDDRYAQEDD